MLNKKNIFGVFLAASLFLIVGFKAANTLPISEDHLAQVHQIEGVPVFLLADPVKEYEILATVPIKRNSYSVRQALLKAILKLKKLEEKEKIPANYDAVIVSDTLDEFLLIRYTS